MFKTRAQPLLDGSNTDCHLELCHSSVPCPRFSFQGTTCTCIETFTTLMVFSLHFIRALTGISEIYVAVNRLQKLSTSAGSHGQC